MDNQVTIFNNEEFGRVRTVVIDNEPWFVGKDVCEVFGDTNYRRSLSRIDEDDKQLFSIDTPGGKQTGTIVNESGLYSILFYMQPSKAKGVSQNDTLVDERIEKVRRFKHWVTSEVLPSLRKNGGYIMGQEKMSDDEIMAQALITANRIIRDRDARIKSLEAERDSQDNKILELNGQIDEMIPASEFANQVSHSDTDILVRDFAKLIQKNGLDIGQNRLYQWFIENGYLDRNKLPYQKYMQYFSVSEYVVDKPSGYILTHTTRITGKGQVYFTKKILDSFRTSDLMSAVI